MKIGIKKIFVAILVIAMLAPVLTACGNSKDNSGLITYKGMVFLSIGDGTCALVDYKGDEKNVNIPENVLGEVVTQIGTEEDDGYTAFKDNKVIEAVNIPSTVHYIAKDSFNGCSNLKYAFLPFDLVYVGSNCFKGCESLAEIHSEATSEFENEGWETDWNPDNITVNRAMDRIAESDYNMVTENDIALASDKVSNSAQISKSDNENAELVASIKNTNMMSAKATNSSSLLYLTNPETEMLAESGSETVLESDTAGGNDIVFEKSSSEVVTDVVTFTVESLTGGFVAAIGGQIKDIAVNSTLSAFGYENPEEVFKKDVKTSFNEIKVALNSVSGKVETLDRKVTELKDFIDVVQSKLFEKIDKSTFDTRMTVINKDIATIDSIYKDYEGVLKETDYNVAKKKTEAVIASVEKADLPSIIQYLKTELVDGTAGSQTPIMGLYKGYLSECFPFEHQTNPRLRNYADYMKLELAKATQLYTEYCNYMQAAKYKDKAAVTMWQQKSAQAISNMKEINTKIDSFIPQGDFTLKVGDTKYHIVNLENNINIYFDSVPLKQSQYEIYDPEYSAHSDYGYRENLIGAVVKREEYKRLKDLSEKYKAKSTLEFVNTNTGNDIKSEVWACDLGDDNYKCPAIHLNTNSTCVHKEGDLIRAWK